MRKIITTTWVTLDGFIAGPHGEMEWIGELYDDAMSTYENELMRKIVFSRTLESVEWNNSTLRKEVVPEEIEHLKQEPGRDMLIYGSASIIQTLTNHGLIDEYQVLVHPVLVGGGKPLFHNIGHQVKLKLVNSKTHPSGVVVLSYQPREQRAAPTVN